MQVAFVSSVFPYPVSYGKRVVVSGLVRFFVEESGPENLLYILTQSRLPEGSFLEQSPCRTLLVGRPGCVRQVFNGTFQIFVGRRKSIQESLLFSPRVRARIKAFLQSFGPDLVVYDSVRSGQYHPRSTPAGVRAILYLEDLFSVRYRRMREFIVEGGEGLDVLGTFAGNIPKLLQPLCSSIAVQKTLLRFEEVLVEKSEVGQALCFSKSLLLNPAEVTELRAKILGRPVDLIRPLLGPSDSSGESQWRGRQEFVFIGNLRYAPNQKSVELFIRDALPGIRALMPNFRLRIIGGGAPSCLIKQVANCGKTVSLEGVVPDLSEVMCQARAVLMPLVFGTAIKLKALLRSHLNPRGVRTPEWATAGRP